MTYQPESVDAYGRLLTFLRTVETEVELRQAIMLYIGDLSYPRADILMAERVIRQEKNFAKR